MNILNIFRRKKRINVVYNDFSFIKKNINLSFLPRIDHKIYFDEKEIYIIRDIIHYYNKREHVIWLIVEIFKQPDTPEILSDN
jgi:hypothetical protein